VDNVSDVVMENTGEGLDAVQCIFNYTLGANLENLVLTGTDNLIGIGNSLNNVFTSNSGMDTLVGGAGNDTYILNNIGDIVVEDASADTDTVQCNFDYSLGANLENLTLTGNAVNGVGNSLNNTITGDSLDNVLDGGVGRDYMIGGLGNDTYFVDNSSDFVLEYANEGVDTVLSSASFTLRNNVENLTLTGTDNLSGIGNNLDNVFISNSGVDTLVGGWGNDTYILNNIDDIVVEEDAGTYAGTDTVQCNFNYTLGTNVENLILTGIDNLIGIGNNLNNVFTSNSGVDTLVGGAGNDTYILNNIGDIVVEDASAGTDTVKCNFNYTLGANLENLTLTGTDNLIGIGNNSDNVITSSSGVDTLVGGTGNDIYIVNNNGDVVIENANEGRDTVQASVNYTLSGTIENLTLTGDSDLQGIGNILNNYLSSNTGVDTLIGGLGDDYYYIHNSSDVVIENAGEGYDRVIASVNYIMPDNVESLALWGYNDGLVGIGGNGDDTIELVGYDDTAYGRGGNDTISLNYNGTAYGESGDDHFNLWSMNPDRAFALLNGGAGNDTYTLINGLGHTTIDNYHTDSSSDRIISDLAFATVQFTLNNNNLIWTDTSTTGSTLTISNWNLGSNYQVDYVQFADQTLTAAQINKLIAGS
jgi:trimeric autotransporter adhesin